MNFKPHGAIVIGLGVNLLVILSLFFISHQRIENKESILIDERHMNSIQSRSENVSAAINQIDNDAERYIITGNKKYLSGRSERIFALENALSELTDLFANQPLQLLEINKLKRVVIKKMETDSELIENIKYKTFDDARKFFYSAEYLKLTNDIDRGISLINAKEQEMFFAQKIKYEAHEKTLRAISITLLVCSILFSIAGYLITRYYLKEKIAASLLLEANKDLLQSIIDNTTNPIFIKDENGKYLFANKQFSSIFGPKNHIAGKTDYDLFPKEMADKIRSNDRDVIKAGKELQFEETYMQNSALHTYMVMKFPISDFTGKQYALGGIATDISQQKKTEFQLAENEYLVNALFDAAPEAVIMIDKQSKILKWNHQSEELFKWQASEVIGKPIYEIIMPARFKQEHLKGMKHFIETGEGPILNKTIELFAVNKNNIEFEIELRVSELLHKGNYIFIAFLRDITQRKKLQKENQQAKMFSESVLENIPDMIFVKDAKELRFVSFNKAGEKLLGYNRSELIGKNDFDFFPRKQAEFFTGKDRMVLEKKRVVDIAEEEIDTKNGKRWLHTKKIPILDEKGVPAYLLGISEDITEKRRLENEKKEGTRKLLENEQRLQLILENIGEGVFVADIHKNILLFNSMAEEILESDQMPFSLDWTDKYNIYYSDGKKIFPVQNLPIEKALDGYATDETEIVIEDRQTKKRKRIKISGQPVWGENNHVVAAVTTMKDITKIRETEKKLEESEMKYRNMIGFKRNL